MVATTAPSARLAARIALNLLGAAMAMLFAQASLRYYLHTHRLVGVMYFAEQGWMAVAFLIRRVPQSVSRGVGSWLLAFGGTFGGLLLRPYGAHPAWGVVTGFVLQLAGPAAGTVSLMALGRSFGLVAADRGVKTRGPYAIVRHPVYAAYLLMEAGYVLQSPSPGNLVVFALAGACNVGRALAEELLLAGLPAYQAYREQTRWRLIPYLW